MIAKPFPLPFKFFLLAGAAMAGPPLAAQDDLGLPSDDGLYENDQIIVRAGGLRGTVQTDIPVINELSEEEIGSYGAGSIEELIDALSTQTGSSRGRGGGHPIVLINGQRVSGFRAIRDLPPEAIERMQVFPEEVALQYGYRPDQRVINFILKENYAGGSVAVEFGMPESGGRSRVEVDSTLTRIGEDSRLNLDLEYLHESRLLESERDIMQDVVLPGFDVGDFRTLLGESDAVEFNGNYSRNLNETTQLSIDAELNWSQTDSLQGVPATSLFIPATSPFAQATDDETVRRFFPELGALNRSSESTDYEIAANLNGQLGSGWHWTLTGEYAATDSRTDTERGYDQALLDAGVLAGTIDPFADNLAGQLGALRVDRADSFRQNIGSTATLSGAPLLLPAGPVQTTIRLGYGHQAIDSENRVASVVTATRLRRDDINGAFNIEIPITSRRENFGAGVGDLSLNANIGYADLSDFGGLVEYGYGLTWEPVEGLSFSASIIGDEEAPSIQQLADPGIITPNVTTFDFTRGETAIVDIISGGNLALLPEERRDLKLAVNYSPDWLDGMTFLAEYFRNRSENVPSSFPVLTPAVEAAFPDRVTRDADGRLIAIDQRPVSYAEVRSDRIRYGFDLRQRIERDEAEAGGERGADRRGAGRGPRGGGPGGGGGRWSLSLFHTIHLNEDILIRDGVPVLDLLDGAATGSAGGQPRHEFELEGGLFMDGIGFRLEGRHQTATRVDGALGASDLYFSDLTVVNMRLFIELDQQGSLTEKLPFLKGGRLILKVDNIFDDIQDVRDDSGLVPLRYQPAYLDPIGRYFEIDFRKRF